jgi:CheY-like chemotaxis protein
LDAPNRKTDPNLRLVLNIEDNSANAALVEQLIARRSDLKLVTAKNGKSGVQFAIAQLPDVILLDIKLPDIGGMEVLKILLSTAQTAHIPVIALSSKAYPKQIEEGLQAGFCLFDQAVQDYLVDGPHRQCVEPQRPR